MSCSTSRKLTNVVWTFNDYYVVQTFHWERMICNQYVSGPFLAYEDTRRFDLNDRILPTFIEYGPIVVAGISRASVCIERAGPQTLPYILTYRVGSNFPMSDYFQQLDEPEEVPVVFPEKEIVKEVSDEEKERNSQQDLHNYWNRTTEPYSRPALVFLEKKKTVPEELRDLRIPGVEWESKCRKDGAVHGSVFSTGNLLAHIKISHGDFKWTDGSKWVCEIGMWYESGYNAVAVRDTLSEAIEATLEGLSKDITNFGRLIQTMRGKSS